MEIDAVLEVEAGDPQIAIDFLVANINLSKSRLKDLMNKGGVWRVTEDGERQRVRRAMTDILVGEQIEIFYDEALLSMKPVKAELLDDQGQYSVWNKPTGMPIDGDDWSDFACFRRALELAFNPTREIFWLSAIDYEASGVVIVAHSRKAAMMLTEQFAPGGFAGAEVHYRGDVQGDIGDITEIDLPVDGEQALTLVEKVRYDQRPDRSVVDIRPKTGRQDQVAIQLSELGHPLVGDERYGPEDEENEGLRLRLVELSFQCPVTGESKAFSVIR